MSNSANERVRSVGHQVPELVGRSLGQLAAGPNGQEPDELGLIEQLHIDRAALRRNHLQQLADVGIELAS